MQQSFESEFILAVFCNNMREKLRCKFSFLKQFSFTPFARKQHFNSCLLFSDSFFSHFFQAVTNTLRASGTLSRLTARFRAPQSLAPTWFTTTMMATRSRCTQWMKSFLKNTSNAKCEYESGRLQCHDSFITVFPPHHLTKCPELKRNPLTNQ